MGIIISKKEAVEISKKFKNEAKTLVFTNGCFDILHIGHVRYLKQSAALGSALMIGLNSDSSVKKLKGETRPINNQNDRAELLSELNFVDYVVIFDETSPSELLKEIKPDIYTKGADYTLETLPEKAAIESYQGKVAFIDLVEGKSTTAIIKSIRS